MITVDFSNLGGGKNMVVLTVWRVRMNALLLVLVVGLMPVFAYAGSTCQTDIYGRYRCNYGNGSSSITQRDIYGRDKTIFTDRYGNTHEMTCQTDVFGRYQCN